MKTTLIVTALLVTVHLAFAQADRMQVIDREQAAWQMYKDKKAGEFRKILSNNYRGVYADNVYTADGEMKMLGDADLKSYSLSRIDVVSLNADTVMLTYQVTMEATLAGKDMSGNYNSASIWQKQGADWKVVFHTNVPVEKAGG